MTLGYLADRFTYFASSGAAFLLALFFVDMFSRAKVRRTLRIFAISAGLLTVLYFMVLTRSLLPVWRNCLNLTGYIVRHYAHDPAAYLNRGLVHWERGEYNKAKQDFACALEVDPEYADASRRIGEIFHELQQPDSAYHYYQRAIRSA